MYTAVACTEDLDSLQKPTGRPDPLMLNANIRAMAQACRSWPRGEVPAGFDKQISPDIPVLALTGEFDPTLGHAMGVECEQQPQGVAELESHPRDAHVGRPARLFRDVGRCVGAVSHHREIGRAHV